MASFHSIHRAVSDLIDAALAHAQRYGIHVDERTTSTARVDDGIVNAAAAGVALGVALTTALAFFPGKPLGIEYGEKKLVENYSKVETDSQGSGGSCNGPLHGRPSGSAVGDDADTDTAPSVNTSCSSTAAASDVSAPATASEATWAGDCISRSKLEATRKILGLTEEQMDQAVDAAREEATRADADERRRRVPRLTKDNWRRQLERDGSYDGLSLNQMVNLVVYLSLFAALIYFVNRDYDDAATRWFVRHFPREARTLGWRAIDG